MSYTPWNGPPEFKPFGWPEPTDLDLVKPWNGPIEFKPHDWEERQLREMHTRRQTNAGR